jgi:hypothetical protein
MRFTWLLALLLVGCVVVPNPTPTPSAAPSTVPTFSAVPTQVQPSSTASSSLAPTPSPATCQPTDQDAYVYHPTRLVVLASCIRVTGTIAVIRTEADGDFHILVALDPEFQHLLTPANNGIELGDLVVEPVCEHSVTQTDAVAVCAGDHDPLTPLPLVGQHVYLEGRLVTDSSHGGWAELHPLYRWGASLGVSEGE